MKDLMPEEELWAVDIRALADDACSWQTIRDGVDVTALPRRKVKSSTAAHPSVLSWRWDRDLFGGRSRNIALALHHARRAGIDTLFVDLVTVDQTLGPADLLHKVSTLAALYRELPVIVAGDRSDVAPQKWERTFRRPWLLYEARSYAVNPLGVTYLGYEPTSSTGVSPADFATQVTAIRSSGFAIYVFYMLWGYIGMKHPEDFKYILPPFHSVLAHLHEQMTRNDFLFAVFLLCAIHEPTQVVDGRIDNGYRINFHDLRLDSIPFERFSVGEHEVSRPWETNRTIHLNGRAVAEWRTKMTSSFDRNWIKVLYAADREILDAMGVPEHIRAQYDATKKERLACLFLDQNAPEPPVRQFTAYQDREMWVQHDQGS